MDSLDLHHIKHSEVNRMLESFLYEHIQKGTTETKVITGNSTHMKKIVLDIVEEYNMSAADEFGNYGALIINMK